MGGASAPPSVGKPKGSPLHRECLFLTRRGLIHRPTQRGCMNEIATLFPSSMTDTPIGYRLGFRQTPGIRDKQRPN